MRVSRAAVVGAGAMGAAIAELLAYNGISVLLKDLDSARVDRGLGQVGRLLDDLVEFHANRADKECARIEAMGVSLDANQRAAIAKALPPRVPASRGSEIRSRVTGTQSYEGFAEVDLVVEAVFESEPAKRTVLEELDRVVPAHAVVASNTSSLSLTRLVRGLSIAPRTLVVHFFNPPGTLPLVEVSPGVETREDIVSDVIEFLQGLRNHRYPLQPIRVKESPAFVVNRLLIPVLNEACFALDEGVASSRDIDAAMKAGAGMPMGPFELADLIGLDVALEVAETMHREFGDPKYRPSPALRRLVDAGHLGRKTGRGFYEYPVS